MSKGIMTGVRLTAEQRNKLRKEAEAFGIKMATHIRNLAMGVYTRRQIEELINAIEKIAYVTPSDLAASNAVSAKTIIREIQRGKIDAIITPTGRYLISRQVAESLDG